ncbi:MAG: outer membrane lipoprotein-sorting protein [Verrucomicrobiota bacterium]
MLACVGVNAAATNTLSDAELQGRRLAQQLCDARPAENFTNTGVLQIRGVKGPRLEMSVECEVISTATNWQSIYKTIITNSDGFTDGNYLKIVHTENQADQYTWNNLDSPHIAPFRSDLGEVKWSGTKFIHPFSRSDFWAVDLGLEFLHWPEQKVLKKEFRRNCSCVVLESANPNPATNGYSRVDSWIDEESGGIVMAKAYDAQGKLLKEFYPKEIKKVKGQWQVRSMEIDNVQTGSSTRLTFDLKSP